MALDTRGLASGFAQGFGLMEQHQQRKINNERADRQEQRQARQDERADQEWGMRMEDRAKEQSLEQIRAFYEQEAAGLMPEMTQELDQAFELHPHLRLDNVYSEETSRSVAIAEQLATGDMDPNEPEALEALNQFLAPEIQAGDAQGLEPGQTARKRIVGVYPGQDPEHLSFDLEVTVLDAEGNPVRSYNAPMTPGHSAADDEVLQVPMEKLINAAVAMKGLQSAIPPEVREQRMQYLRSMGVISQGQGQYQTIEGPGGSILQVGPDGKMSSVLGRERTGEGSTNMIREIEYFMAQNPGMTFEEASAMYRRMRGHDRPSTADQTLQLTRLEMSRSRIIQQLQEGRMTGMLSAEDEARLQRSLDLHDQQINALDSPGLQIPQQAQGQQQAPQAEQPQQTVMQDSEDVDDQLRQLW